MLCQKCGNQIEPNDRFCQFCGTPLAVVTPKYQQPLVPVNASPMQVDPQQKAVGKARTSIIFGGIGLGCSFIWFASFIGLVLSIVAVVKSSKSRKMGYTGAMAGVGKGLGIAGIILSSLMTLFVVFMFILYLLEAMSMDNEYYDEFYEYMEEQHPELVYNEDD